MKARRYTGKRIREVNAQLANWSRKRTRLAFLMSNNIFDFTVAGRLEEGPTAGVFVFGSLNKEIYSRLIPALYKPTIDREGDRVSIEWSDGRWTLKLAEIDTLRDLFQELPPANQLIH